MKILNPTITIALSILAFFSSATGAQVFNEIANVPQDVTRVNLYDGCPGGRRGYRTRAMITIQPNTDDDGSSDEVKIVTFPKDLVIAKERIDGQLELEFNAEVAFDTDVGGIQIFFPPDQLKAVSVSADAQAQILDGFTSIESVSVSSDAKLQANLNSLEDQSDLDVSVTSDARATIISRAALKKLHVSSDGYLRIQTPNISTLSVSSDGFAEINGNILSEAKVSSDAKVTIDGNLDADASISSDAKVTVFGSVTGTVNMSSDAKLNVGNGGSITGKVHASTDAHVRAPNCDNVSTHTDAKCRVDNGIEGHVSVEVKEQALTLQGTDTCGYLSPDGVLALTLSLLAVAIFVAAIVTCCYFCCRGLLFCCCCCWCCADRCCYSFGIPYQEPTDGTTGITTTTTTTSPTTIVVVETHAVTYTLLPDDEDGNENENEGQTTETAKPPPEAIAVPVPIDKNGQSTKEGVVASATNADIV